MIKLGKSLRSDPIFWSIVDQCIKSITSIGANVTEASSAISTNDYIRFFQYALKSANESKYWLDILAQTSPAHAAKAKEIRRETDEIARILGSSIVSLKSKK